MHPIQKQYVTNESGTKIAVQLDIRSYQRLEEYIELLEDRIDLELAMKESPDLTNWDDFVKELREEGKL
uniref:Antitoxin n=1 Tax=Candidatus Methanogaster sp. ANME-2c ERB4 TaxID=2759911 RepID=A0A7G9YHK9_9EURY|nr:hypothetical protein MJFALNKJ_00026 [Methanosarcinales archaeon ANME-2c ERB4]